jgi:osmotically-inducible protein OsmY
MKSDSQLQRDVIAELEWDPSLDHEAIGVSVAAGVVALNGYVKSYAEKLAAERAVQRVAGVRGIAEELKVRVASDPKTADHEIAKRILDIFSWNVLIPEERIQVKVENGWVTLSGSVTWNYQREEARKAAGVITGVKGISNNVAVSHQPTTADVRHRIEAAFDRQAELDAGAVTIAIEDNTVKLGGMVKSWRERQIAEDAAWAAPGVTRVEDHIGLAL